MKHRSAIVLFLLLTACPGSVVVQDRPVTVRIPVNTPCVAGARPAPVASLQSQHPGWKTYSHKQKTELTAAQTLRHKSYGEAVNAATGACQ